MLQRVAATSEHATTAKFFLGKMHYRLEMLEEALDMFQEVRSQVVYSPILFFFMAKIHARRGRLEQALNEYRQLLRNLGILKLRFECSVCGHRTTDFLDRCESCNSWNSIHFLFKENDLPELPLRPESGSWRPIRPRAARHWLKSVSCFSPTRWRRSIWRSGLSGRFVTAAVCWRS